MPGRLQGFPYQKFREDAVCLRDGPSPPQGRIQLLSYPKDPSVQKTLWRWKSSCSTCYRLSASLWMRLCAYSWELPAYNGAFLLTIENFSFSTCSWSFFTYSWSFFSLQWESASNKGLKGLQAKKLNCKKKSSNCK